MKVVKERSGSSRSKARRERQRRHARGHLAERLARLLLLAKGYRLLARRYRAPVGEIDLVVRRGRRLAFVEVKRRASLEEAAEAVTPSQQARIARAAAHWLARHPGHGARELAFDVILIAPGRFPRHLQNAFPGPAFSGAA